MSRALFIGGFGSSHEMLQPVGEALERHFEEVDLMSLREAEGNQEEVRRAARGAELFAHSGGIGPTANTRPSALHGLGAAIPTNWAKLLLRTGIKQVRMHIEDPKLAWEFERGCMREIFGHTGFHGRESFQVAGMDALGIAGHHRKMGTPATLAYFDNDAYFKLNGRDRNWAGFSGVNLVRLTGQHDEILLRPQETIDSYLMSANSERESPVNLVGMKGLEPSRTEVH